MQIILQVEGTPSTFLDIKKLEQLCSSKLCYVFNHLT